MTFLTCTKCGKQYDVSDRSPGTIVKCRSCDALLTVPAGSGASGPTHSDRLRLAQGETCAEHTKELAVRRCEACLRAACKACVEKPPVDHLCRACAAKAGTTSPVAVPFGFKATPLVAARAFGAAWKRLLGLSVVLNGGSLLALVVIMFASRPIWLPLYQSGARIESFGDFLRAAVAVGAMLALLVVPGFVSIVLIPASEVLLLDSGLRGTQGKYWDDVKAAIVRAYRKKWSLLLGFVFSLLCLGPAIVVFLPFFLLSFLMDWNRRLFALGFLLAIPAVGAGLACFGLVIPAIILEHRPARQALGRAWGLFRRRARVASAIGAIWFLVFVAGMDLVHGFAPLADQTTSQFGKFTVLTVAGAASFLLDLIWPSILVGAYHGLLAEELGLRPKTK